MRRRTRRDWVLDHLIDITVGFFGAVMLVFLAVDIARGDADGAGSVLVTIVTLGALWAITRTSLRSFRRSRGADE